MTQIVRPIRIIFEVAKVAYSIGEFSRITGLTVKALRFYHDQGVLVPSYVDPDTGYRYYSEQKVETARAIDQLRQLDVPVSAIRDLLAESGDDAGLIDYLEAHRERVQKKLLHYQQITDWIDRIIQSERETKTMIEAANYEIIEKDEPKVLMAAYRMRAKYSECGSGFAKLGKSFGRYACGKPFTLYHELEYREGDAEYDVCFPIKRGSATDEIDVREFAGGRCVTLLHQGPYDELRIAYQRLFDYLKTKEYEPHIPIREVYHKGPGMILRGNPKKYLTEIQLYI